MIPRTVVGILILVITCGAQNRLWYDLNAEEDVCNQKVDFFGNGMFNERFVLPLPNDFGPGSEIEIFGYSPFGAEKNEFNFNTNERNYDTLLHFNPRFSAGVIVINSLINGQWDKENATKNIWTTPGQSYILRVMSTDEEFKIWINGYEFQSYKHQADPRRIKKLEINKAFFVRHVIYTSNRPCKTDSFSKEPYDKEKTCTQTLNFFGGGMYSKHFILSLPSNFSPGAEVGISGKIPSTTDNVVINFIPTQDWNDIENIALHFKLRFCDGKIVRNSKLNRIWQKEEISNNINLVKGQNFTLKFIYTDESYIMMSNGVEIGTFRHRGNPNAVTIIQSTSTLFIDHIDYKNNHACKNIKKETENNNFGKLNDTEYSEYYDETSDSY